MINRIAIISIPVTDQAASKSFYLDVLGFVVLNENPMGPNQTWVQLTLPGAETSISLVTWFDAMLPGSVQGIVIDTDNIESERQALKTKGLKIGDIEDQPWGKFAAFSDPDGNGWILQQADL